MELTAWSIVPPIIVLFLGMRTQRVLFSLLCGILSAGIIAANGSLFKSISLITQRFFEISDVAKLTSLEGLAQSDTVLIFFFLVNIGVITILLGKSGGAYAYTRFVKQYLKNKAHVEIATLILPLFLFIDDYFSALTVGTVMTPLADEYKVPRAKLAFLVDTMAAPFSIFIPITSWVAMILGQLDKSGIHTVAGSGTIILGEPLMVYLSSIPFIFYSFVVITTAWYIVLRRVSFGLMRYHEYVALNSNNMFGGKPFPQSRVQKSYTRHNDASIFDFLIPIITLISSIFSIALYSGDAQLFGGSRTIIEAFRYTNSYIALALGSAITIGVTFCYLLVRGKMTAKSFNSAYYSGFMMMFTTMIILLFSWTLGSLLNNDLNTGRYLANLLVGSVSVELLPVMLFIASGIISFSMGSSWGTIGIMFPIAVPMVASLLQLPTPVAVNDVTMLLPVLGAILSGAVFGDHISPISDTTVMTSTSTGAYHIDHVKTQATYTIPVFISVAIAFLCVGYLVGPYGALTSSSVSLGIGVLCSFAFAQFFNTPIPKDA